MSTNAGWLGSAQPEKRLTDASQERGAYAANQ